MFNMEISEQDPDIISLQMSDQLCLPEVQLIQVFQTQECPKRGDIAGTIAQVKGEVSRGFHEETRAVAGPGMACCIAKLPKLL